MNSKLGLNNYVVNTKPMYFQQKSRTKQVSNNQAVSFNGVAPARKVAAIGFALLFLLGITKCCDKPKEQTKKSTQYEENDKPRIPFDMTDPRNTDFSDPNNLVTPGTLPFMVLHDD